MKDFTIALIKPDAVRRKVMGKIVHEMEQYYDIVDLHTAHWPRSFAGSFYAEHISRPFYPALVDFMTSGPLAMVILRGPDAVQSWRDLMGATDPMKANPHTIRAKYAAKDGVVMHNAVHGSDSPEAAERELWLIRQNLHPRSHAVANTGSILPEFGSALLS